MSTIAVGDEVALPQGHRAILRWIGRIPGRTPVEYAGVEVLGPDAERLGKHSGSYQGQQIFHTSKPGTGLFVSYTQLVGANVKSARVETPRQSRAVAVMSPAAYDTVSPSPRYHKPPTRMQSMVSLAGAGEATTEATPSELELRAELEKLRADRAAERKAFDAKRAEFRDTLRVVNERLEQFAREYEARVAEVRDAYEEKLKSARRSSSLMNAGGSEVQEQRLALAAMQNKLVAERTEKQEEIDTLKRELAHVRKITGGAEDLEALVADLGSMEQQLKDMRAKVEETDALQRELESIRIRNAELELAVKSEQRAFDAVSRDEYARLEQALETRLLREAELEARNEQLQAELAELRLAQRAQSERAAEAAKQAATDAVAGTHTAAHKVTHTAPHASTHTERELSTSPGHSAHSNSESSQGGPETPKKPAEKPAEEKPVRDATETPARTTETPARRPTDSWSLTPDPHSEARPAPLPALPADADESNTSQFADLAAGRKDWCSLCERQGHSAIDCPFI